LPQRRQSADKQGVARVRAAASTLTGAVLALAALAPSPGSAQTGKIETAYVVVGEDGPIARAILSNASECPTIDIGGVAGRMSVRAGANAAFPVLVCEASIPPGTSSAAIGARGLPLPQATPGPIAAFGDTGCRLKAPDKERSDHDHSGAERFQDCDSRSKWPFSRLSATAAARKPGLVIHVGDYLYRESPCLRGDKGCKGSPYGDNWATWQADFFRPADRLLAAAPWIAVRGNHETCARAGPGFFRFLHPKIARDDAPPTCTDFLPPYAAEVGGKSFLVIDSSDADDTCPDDACDSAPYAAQFASLQPKPGTWLLSHRPVWAIGRGFTLNRTLQQALKSSGGRLPRGIELVLSGHVHVFALLRFTDQRPPRVVSGAGGTSLDKKIERGLDGMKVGDATVNYGRSDDRFGFLMITLQEDGSTATFIAPSGKARFTCALAATTARCD
jgi:hypothetical protein